MTEPVKRRVRVPEWLEVLYILVLFILCVAFLVATVLSFLGGLVAFWLYVWPGS